jgi:hypothetical protein
LVLLQIATPRATNMMPKSQSNSALRVIFFMDLRESRSDLPILSKFF